MMELLKPIARSADWFSRSRENRRPPCALASCMGRKSLWQRVFHPRAGTFVHGHYYCSPDCLEIALTQQISRLNATPPSTPPTNRIPLGLLMVARGKLTHLEVRAALEAQRRARYGTIGDWIEKLGFASEREVMAALALQWGCPVASSFDLCADNSRVSIPLAILEAFRMIPFNYAASTNTLYLAFGARVDHAALYAVEKILDCRSQPCAASPKRIAHQLEQLRQLPHPNDVEFVTREFSEMVRITSSYIARISPDEVRLSRIGKFVWLRLTRQPLLTNLVFSMEPRAAQSQTSVTLSPGAIDRERTARLQGPLE